MGSTYTVKSGDSLSKIAQAHGFKSWQQIYFHDDNATFRELRPNPNLIFPGDKLILPDLAPPPPPPPPPLPPPPPPAPVGKIVVARDGDSFCSIAHTNGFLNCGPLRDANPAIAERQLQQGDSVFVPVLRSRSDPGPTETKPPILFRVLGQSVKLTFVAEHNRPAPEDAPLLDQLTTLAVSNYVPTRQGSGFTNGDWVDHTFFGHDANASLDTDHFKIQIFDKRAGMGGDAEIKVKLNTLQPVLDAAGRVTGFSPMSEAGTSLEVVCKRVRPGSFHYRSHYLRLVVDTQDHTAKRPQGRSTDTGTDVSKQTLVTPLPADNRIEVLDLRVMAEREYADCARAGNARCRAVARAFVGRGEMQLKLRVFRVGGPSGANGANVSNAEAESMIANMRLTLAQSNVGVFVERTPAGELIHDVPLPTNLIAVSDEKGETASGGGIMRVRVRLNSSIVEASIVTKRKDKPAQTANKLAAALQAKGVTAQISPNPPVQNSGDNFGSCDILCFDQGLPARIISATSTDNDQKLSHSGGFRNNSVDDTTSTYGSTRGSNALLVGNVAFRAAAKNNDVGPGSLRVILVNDFARSELLGKALLPSRDAPARIRPLQAYSMCVFLDQQGAKRKTVLAHEAGHVLLDAFHTTTTDTNGAERDLDGLPFDNNTNLGFSEWMSALSRESSATFMHKRMSNDPLTVKYLVIKRGVNTLQAEIKTLGGGEPSPVERFRSLSAAVLEPLRTLRDTRGNPVATR